MAGGLRGLGIALLLGLLLIARPAQASFTIAEGFIGVESAQKTPVWCWAAVIQMVLNKNGVHWTQEDVVQAVKGQLSIQTATSQEITRFLNRWGFDYSGAVWKSRSIHKYGAPKPGYLLHELKNDRPLILAFKTGPFSSHVVVAYAALTKELGNGASYLQGVFIYDPYTNAKKMIPGKQFFAQVKEHWFVDVRKY